MDEYVPRNAGVYQSALRHNPDLISLQGYHHENLKSYVKLVFCFELPDSSCDGDLTGTVLHRSKQIFSIFYSCFSCFFFLFFSSLPTLLAFECPNGTGFRFRVWRLIVRDKSCAFSVSVTTITSILRVTCNKQYPFLDNNMTYSMAPQICQKPRHNLKIPDVRRVTASSILKAHKY